MNRRTVIRILVLAAFVAAGVFAAGVSGHASGQAKPQEQVQKGKIYQETYPLITETDLYCSFSVLDGPLPDLKVIGAERQAERILLGDGDIIYLNAGEKQAVAPGQVFLLFEKRDDVTSSRTGKNYGPLIQKVGRGRVIQVDEKRAVLRIEKSCLPVRLGDYAIVFTEKKGLTGKDAGFVPYARDRAGQTKGQVIYIQGELKQIGSNSWAVIDLGAEDGLTVGNQVTLSTVAAKDLPKHAVGNAVVIDVQPRTATVKVLSASDAIRIGHEVTVK
jgi:hypothetical protein